MEKKTIEEKIAWLFDLNKIHADELMRTRSLRQLYRARHPTEISVFKCSDGRVNIYEATNMPSGIIRPYRNIGGYFDLGWPLLGEDLKDWVDYGISKGKKSLILITYHYSQSDRLLGCAGFNCDHQAAFKFTINFLEQVNRFFGENNQVVFPIIVGLETDTDALIFHPEKLGEIESIACSEKTSDSTEDLLKIISILYPGMDTRVMQDLIPLMQGNIAHIKELQIRKRCLADMQHKEWVLLVGRGSDWLHVPNTALIIGPFDPDSSKPIIKAIGIIKKNIDSRRIGDDGFLILSSAQFKEEGVDKNRAREEACYFSSYIRGIISENYSDLLLKARFIAVIVDERTRRMEKV